LGRVTSVTPQIAEQLFARVGNMTPSKSSLDRLPKVLADRWDDDKVTFEKTLREAMAIPEEAVTVMASLDGVLAPMKDGDAAGKKAKAAEEGQIAKGPAGYREVGCATLSFCDSEGKCLAAVRMAQMPEARKSDGQADVDRRVGRRPCDAPRPAPGQGSRRCQRQLDIPARGPARG
jgi:hypothetical protein